MKQLIITAMIVLVAVTLVLLLQTCNPPT